MVKYGLQPRAAYINFLTPFRVHYNQGRLTIEQIRQVFETLSKSKMLRTAKFKKCGYLKLKNSAFFKCLVQVIFTLQSSLLANAWLTAFFFCMPTGPNEWGDHLSPPPEGPRFVSLCAFSFYIIERQEMEVQGMWQNPHICRSQLICDV